MNYPKALVLFLVLANAGYFLWVQDIANPSSATDRSPAAPKLKLASEAVSPARAAAMPVSAHSSSKPASPAAPAVLPASHLLTDVKRCISVGPFLDVAEAVRAASTLRSGGYQPRQRVAVGDVWDGEWVFLPLPAAPATAGAMRAKLQAGGIEDALEMPGPNDTPVLSLGLFSEPQRAQARVRQIRALGFAPQIAERKRSGDVYWVDIDLKPTDAMLNPGDLESQKGRIVRLQVKACPAS